MHRNILYFDDALRNGEAIHGGAKLSGFWEYRPLSRQHVIRASLKLGRPERPVPQSGCSFVQHR
jgi:hypothetical protein